MHCISHAFTTVMNSSSPLLRPLLTMVVISIHALVFGPPVIRAQSCASIIDIGLFPKPGDPNTLQVKVRAQETFSEVVSNLTFTIRWETASGANLGVLQFPGPFGPGWCAQLQTSLAASGDGEVDAGGFRYQTYNGFALGQLSGCPFQPGYSWPAGVEVVLTEIAILNNTGCANFNIVNDSFTEANNKNFFFSLNGIQDCEGVIYSAPYTNGACLDWYSRASGSVSDPIWSNTPLGPAGPATFAQDRNVYIQSGHAVAMNMGLTAKDLEVEMGASLSLGTDTLRTYGQQIRLLGSVVPGTGALELLGSGTIGLALANPTQLWDLTVAAPAGVVVSGGLDIRGTLQLNEGNFDASGATVRLRSLASGTTGRLGPVDFDAFYTGQLTMQRRIPAGVTNWRLLSSPVVGMTIADWDDDFITAGFPGSNFPNFDQPVGSGILWPSVRWYDETNIGTNVNDGLVGAPGIDYALSPGQGFAVWCGDASGGTAAFVIDVTGAPIIAPEALVLPMTWTSTGVSTADGWNLVGNPLPSPIAFTGVNRSTNVLNQYHVYNPVTGNNAVWNGLFGTNGANGILQSSQGFWLKTNGPDIITSVNEASKVSGNSGGLFGGPLQMGGALAMTRLTIGSAINGFSDETLVVFEDGTPAYSETESDVLQMVFSNPSAPQIATRSSDGLALSINMHGTYGPALSIPVLVNVGISGTYTITASNMDGLSGLGCLVLEDLLTGVSAPLFNGATYSFAINASAPADVPRFLLRTSSILPLVVTDASCWGAGDGQAAIDLGTGVAEVTWTLSDGTLIGGLANATGIVLIDGLDAGNYILTVSGGEECIQLQTTISIVEPFELEGIVTAEQSASCPYNADGFLELELLGGTSPLNYEWSDGSTGTAYLGLPGLVSVVVTDANGCTWNAAWNLGSGGAPQAGISGPSFGEVGSDITFSALPALADEHSWDLGDGTAASGAEVTHSYLVPGIYQVTLIVTDGGCSDTTQVSFMVDQTTGLNSSAQAPSNGAWFDGERFVIALPGHCKQQLRTELFDATGQLVWEGSLPCASDRITLARLDIASGIWLLRVQLGQESRTYRVPVLR